MLRRKILESKFKSVIIGVLIIAAAVGIVRAAATSDTVQVGVTVNPTISITAPADATIGAITGTGLGTAADVTWNIKTNNSAGYKMEWQASAAAMTSGADTIAAYGPATPNTPEAWTVEPTASEWGARLKSASTDTKAEWGTDVTLEKWLNVNNAAVREIVSRTTETDAAGSNQTVSFKAEVGASKWQPTGTYTVNVTITATTL